MNYYRSLIIASLCWALLGAWPVAGVARVAAPDSVRAGGTSAEAEVMPRGGVLPSRPCPRLFRPRLPECPSCGGCWAFWGLWLFSACPTHEEGKGFAVSGFCFAAELAVSAERVPAVVRVALAFAGSAYQAVKPRKLGSSALPLPACPCISQPRRRDGRADIAERTREAAGQAHLPEWYDEVSFASGGASFAALSPSLGPP